MANGPSKTMGLTKFVLNLTGLTVSIFLAVMCVSQCQFFHKAVTQSRVLARLRKS